MKKLLVFIFISMLFGCSLNTSLKLEEINLSDFKKDRKACLGLRKEMLTTLEQQKKNFLGINENEIYYSLGRFDYQNLDKKNEKVIVYFLEKGPQCENLRNRTQSKCLILKLNSVSLVKEALIQVGGYE
jgi:hypothetical protein